MIFFFMCILFYYWLIFSSKSEVCNSQLLNKYVHKMSKCADRRHAVTHPSVFLCKDELGAKEERSLCACAQRMSWSCCCFRKKKGAGAPRGKHGQGEGCLMRWQEANRRLKNPTKFMCLLDLVMIDQCWWLMTVVGLLLIHHLNCKTAANKSRWS